MTVYSIKEKIKPILKQYPLLYRFAYKRYYATIRLKQCLLDAKDTMPPYQDFSTLTPAMALKLLIINIYRPTTITFLDPQCAPLTVTEGVLAAFIMSFLRKYHAYLLRIICSNISIMRKYTKKRTINNVTKIRILHITCSFDLGGTQRQIINISRTGPSYFAHEAIEVFPEHNFLYRQDAGINIDLYTKGNIFKRILGYLTCYPPIRACQIMQIYKLARDIDRIQPDIVIGWGHEIAMLAFAAAAIKRVPKIIFCIRTFNPSFGWTMIGPLLHKSHKKMVPHVDGIIVNSSILKKDYADWLCISSDKIEVCPNGIDPIDLSDLASLRKEFREKHRIPDNGILITNIGRFSEEKGQMYLLQVFHRLTIKYPHLKLYCMLCGDGPIMPMAAEYADKNNLKNVYFPGRINNIHSYLSATDVFVMPSDFEGMPNAMMEAMAHGIPCISANRSGALDIARKDVEALYFDAGSIAQLEEKLHYLIEHPHERNMIGEKARLRLNEFSVNKMKTLFETHINDFLKKNTN